MSVTQESTSGGGQTKPQNIVELQKKSSARLRSIPSSEEKKESETEVTSIKLKANLFAR